MYNADIPLRQVPVGSYLLLGDDPLLDQDRYLNIFCEPAKVLALHPRRKFDEGKFASAGHTIVYAEGFEQPTGRELSVELARPGGGRVLVRYPDDRHLVGAVNLPGQPVSAREPNDESMVGRLVWLDGWRIEYG